MDRLMLHAIGAYLEETSDGTDRFGTIYYYSLPRTANY